MEKTEQNFEKYIDDNGRLNIPELSDPSEIEALIKFINDENIPDLICHKIHPEIVEQITKLIDECDKLIGLDIHFIGNRYTKYIFSAIIKHPNLTAAKFLNPYPYLRVKIPYTEENLQTVINYINNHKILRLDCFNVNSNDIDNLVKVILECEQLQWLEISFADNTLPHPELCQAIGTHPNLLILKANNLVTRDSEGYIDEYSSTDDSSDFGYDERNEEDIKHLAPIFENKTLIFINIPDTLIKPSNVRYASKYENNDNFTLIHYSEYIHIFSRDRKDYIPTSLPSKFDFVYAFEEFLINCHNHILARNHVLSRFYLDMLIELLKHHDSFPMTTYTDLIDLNDALIILETEFNNPTKRRQCLQKLWPLSKESQQIKTHIATAIFTAKTWHVGFLEHPYQKYLFVMLLLEDDKENSLFKKAFQYAVHFSKNPDAKAPSYSKIESEDNLNFECYVFYCLMFQIMRELVQILPSEFSDLIDVITTLLSDNDLDHKKVLEVAISLSNDSLTPYLIKCPSYSAKTLDLLADYAKNPEKQGVFDPIKFKLFDSFEKWLENPWEFEKNNVTQRQMHQMRLNQAILERKVDVLTEENKQLREILDKRTDQLLKQSNAQQKMLETLMMKPAGKEKAPQNESAKGSIGKSSGSFF